MRSKIFKSILSISLAAIITLTPVSLPLAADGSTVSGSATGAPGNAEIKSKDEVIYAILASNGNVRSIHAVKYFALAEAGNITDYGDYTSVINLTDTARIMQTGGAVTVQTDAKNFYYQGNLAGADLPWLFDISYFLDGVKIEPPGLAGKSGKLEFRIKTKENAAVNPAFYENYMLQISLTLDTEKCSEIRAPGATVAGAGKNKILVYTVMPGKDANISLGATVRDFEMTGIDISAMPFSMNMGLPDTGSMINDFADLADAISELNDGVGEMADGVIELKTGAGKLTKGSLDIKTGFSELRGSSGQLIRASSEIGVALSQIASAFGSSSGKMDLDDLSELPEALLQLAKGLDGISAGLIELKGGFTPAYGALAGAIEGIPDGMISEEQIAEIYEKTDSSQHDLLGQLVASYGAGQTVKGTYNQVEGAFDAVGPTLDTLSASIDKISVMLGSISENISDALSGMDMMEQLAQLSVGLSKLDRNYSVFHNGLKGYMDGVDELSSGYTDFHGGLSSLGDGVIELYDGVLELHDGTSELNDETAKMPGMVQSKIDDMVEQYTGSEFEPISFTSPKNEQTDLVQFMLKCEGIEKPEKTEDARIESSNETFWDRLVALFAGKGKK